MELFPVYLLSLLLFTNRYVVGSIMKVAWGWFKEDKDPTYEPTVTVVIPLFNEGEQIFHTIQSLLEQDYPADKLKVIVVDDCSTDDSFTWAKKAEAAQPTRVQAIRNPQNMGKRRGINNAVRHADTEIIVSVDSDVIVDKRAVRELVCRFTRPEIKAVGGRVNVLNANQNWLTRMQTIKYWFGYEYLKNIEKTFGSVLCLSGCLTAYRREVLIELEPILENRNILGVEIKYGEDRFLTRQIVKKGYATINTLDAVCWTVAPDTLPKYFNQQLRWRRSNIVDSLGALSHVWKLHPVVGIHYLSLFAMLLSYPMVVFHSMVRGTFWQACMAHMAVLAFMGTVYAVANRKRPEAEKVHPLWFMTMGFLMPVTYLINTPLAFFTLDSSSWETRGHQGSPAADAEPAAVPAAAETALVAAALPDAEPATLRLPAFSVAVGPVDLDDVDLGAPSLDEDLPDVVLPEITLGLGVPANSVRLTSSMPPADSEPVSGIRAAVVTAPPVSGVRAVEDSVGDTDQDDSHVVVRRAKAAS
jgi:cellulose synthase/poly-beta-1,6-N-acetylglucosamine synthase-like glycosyltransferase